MEYARESLLQSVRPSLEKKTYFRDLAQSWSSKGRRIDSIDDLIRCYYSSFSVVRIPAEGRYALLDKQIGALGDTISACCNDAFNSKRRANMLSNSDELSVFLQSAFDHFARDLQTPFNFIEISRRNNVSYTENEAKFQTNIILANSTGFWWSYSPAGYCSSQTRS